MKQISRIFIYSFFCLSLTSYVQASICQGYLHADEHGLNRAWHEFLLTDPNGELSLSRKKFIEDHFVGILVTNYINNHRPDLADQRELATELISSDIKSLKSYISFKQMLIYAKFENIKKFLNQNPEEYRVELSILKENIDSLSDLITANLVY